MADDFVIRAKWVLPVVPDHALEDHAVVVRDGKIHAVGPAREFSEPEVRLDNHILIPGLVNAHTQAAMTLVRGRGEEPRQVSADFVRDGTLLACAEMLAGGITCFNNTDLFPEASLEAAVAAGMRSVHGMVVSERATAYASDAEDYLRKGLALRDRSQEEPLASFSFAPLAADSMSDATLRRIAALAAELDVPVHIDLHESLERLLRLGLLGPGLTVVLSKTKLGKEETELLARHGCSVVHCPRGFAPVADLSAHGVNIALGTGSAAVEYRLDLFSQMRGSGLDGRAALRAATLGGAQAAGLASRIGSIEPGKAADLTAIFLGAPRLRPCHDPASLAAHAAGREDVSHVWVGGRLALADGRLQNAAFSRLDTSIELWQNPSARAGS